MKSFDIFRILIVLMVLQSCKENRAQVPNENAIPSAEKFIATECYQAIYEEDTLALKLNTENPAKISGTMTMHLYGKPAKEGRIAGVFRGDTLFAYYTFTQGSNKKVTFKNPLALLRKGDQLILGNGEIETTMGASYFVKGKPIDFEQVRYKFKTVGCGNQ